MKFRYLLYPTLFVFPAFLIPADKAALALAVWVLAWLLVVLPLSFAFLLFLEHYLRQGEDLTPGNLWKAATGGNLPREEKTRFLRLFVRELSGKYDRN